MPLIIRLDETSANEALGSLPRDIFRAKRSAIATTTTWAKKRLQSEAIAKSGLPSRVFRQFRIRSKIYAERGVVWIGLNPVKAVYVGELSQDTGGAWAGKFYFKGGFIATMPSGHTGIFKRTNKNRRSIVEQVINTKALVGNVPEQVAAEATTEVANRFLAKLTEYRQKRAR